MIQTNKAIQIKNGWILLLVALTIVVKDWMLLDFFNLKSNTIIKNELD